ncbi:MAG: DUF1361 domain-containing protein [Bacteroidetes bacterium HGW-Bacteroidetes-23]|nr:MAG: DUF1361 domain-containing protein [Bacteroidetes bacterium HGW-Bacteroidetes-23]
MKKLIYYQTIRKNEVIVFATLTLFCLLLLLIRAKVTQSVFFFFLIWNLFLAFIPYLISFFLFTSVTFQERRSLRIGTLLVWLLFLPNSFYLLTDFVHLNKFPDVPFWFDLVLVSSFSITGFALGLFSIRTIEKIIQLHYSKTQSKIMLFCILYLTAFGIYLGRFLRFNSWDLLSNPIDLFSSCVDCLFMRDVQNFTLDFGTFLLVLYSVSSALISKNIHHD